MKYFIEQNVNKQGWTPVKKLSNKLRGYQEWALLKAEKSLVGSGFYGVNGQVEYRLIDEDKKIPQHDIKEFRALFKSRGVPLEETPEYKRRVKILKMTSREP